MSPSQDEARCKILEEVDYIRNIRLPELLRQVNAMSPTTRLPDEILLLFFELHLHNSAQGRRYADLYSLIIVCARWRRIIMGAPSLWSEIRDEWWRHIPILLKRSGAAPLNIFWNEDGQQVQKFLNFQHVLKKCTRLRSVDMTITCFIVERLLKDQFVHKSFPLLESINIVSHGDFSVAFPIKTLTQTPQLRSLCLERLNLDLNHLARHAPQTLAPIEKLALSDEPEAEYFGNLHLTTKLLSAFALTLKEVHLTLLPPVGDESSSDADSDPGFDDITETPTPLLIPHLDKLTFTGSAMTSPLFRLPASIVAEIPYAVHLELPLWRDNEDEEKMQSFVSAVIRVLSGAIAQGMKIRGLRFKHDERLEMSIIMGYSSTGDSKGDRSNGPWRTVTLSQARSSRSWIHFPKEDKIFERSVFNFLLPKLTSSTSYGSHLRTVRVEGLAVEHFASVFLADAKSPSSGAEMLTNGRWAMLELYCSSAEMAKTLPKITQAFRKRKAGGAELPNEVQFTISQDVNSTASGAVSKTKVKSEIEKWKNFASEVVLHE